MIRISMTEIINTQLDADEPAYPRHRPKPIHTTSQGEK